MAVDESQDLLDQVAGEKPAAEAPPQAPQQAPQQTPPGGDLLDEVNIENKKNSGTLGKISETTKSWWDWADKSILEDPQGSVGKKLAQENEVARQIIQHEIAS